VRKWRLARPALAVEMLDLRFNKIELDRRRS
jgi:hypothetical protein